MARRWLILRGATPSAIRQYRGSALRDCCQAQETIFEFVPDANQLRNDGPNLGRASGDGDQDQARALGERGEPALSLQSSNLQKFDLDQEER